MSTGVLRSQGNMKFKITTKGICGNPGEKPGANITKGLAKNVEKSKAFGIGNQPSILPTKSLKRKAEESLESQMGKKEKSGANITTGLVKNEDKAKAIGTRNQPPLPPTKSLKRKPEVHLDSQMVKKAKLDSTLKTHCGSILKELMSTDHSRIFCEPVDPVELNIPDYFSVIRKPMDLGTVEQKLKGNMYPSAEDFAADVKLTFSNAMRYNPKENQVHTIAKKMYADFCRSWGLLEVKLKQTKENDGKGSFVQRMESIAPVAKKGVRSNMQGTKPTGLKLKQAKENDEKGSFVHCLESNAPVAKKVVRSYMQGTKSTGLKKKCVDSSRDDKARAEVCIMDATNGKVKPPARTGLNASSSLRRTLQKGTEPCGQRVSKPIKHSQSVDSAQTMCFSCVSIPCHCRFGNGPTQPSTSELSSERWSENNWSSDSRHDIDVKHSLASHGSSFFQEIDGPEVVIYEEKSTRPLTPAIVVPSVEGLSSVDIEMPPKSSRVATLLKRFRGIISKASNQVDKDTSKMWRESERLEREKKLKKAKIEEEIRAAEEAMRKKEEKAAEEAMRKKEEKDLKAKRAAARKALHEMKKTVNIYVDMNIMKELETLCLGSQCGRFLERFGLFFKQDYMEEYNL